MKSEHVLVITSVQSADKSADGLRHEAKRVVPWLPPTETPEEFAKAVSAWIKDAITFDKDGTIEHASLKGGKFKNANGVKVFGNDQPLTGANLRDAFERGLKLLYHQPQMNKLLAAKYPPKAGTAKAEAAKAAAPPSQDDAL